MPKTVTLQPSSKRFQVEDGETVLAAALRQGVHLPYGCRTGSCGTCRAHLAEGQSHYPDGPPLALTALETGAGEALLCRAVPLTDLCVEAQEIDAMANLRVKAMPCRVAKLERLCHDVMGLFLRLPAVERLQFLPGQYIDILMPDEHRRSFSLANPPHDDANLELHIRHVPERGQRRDIVFYWGARAARDLYADAKLKAWAASQPGFRYVPVLSDPMAENRWTGRTGFVHLAALEDFPDLSGYDIYLSGPPPMVQAARAAFPAKGADP